MKHILFVCTGNSCRSVMAEGLCRKLLGDRAKDYYVSSAGVSAIEDFSATEETVRVMKEAGVDVSYHRSQRLSAELVDKADKIIVMEQFHRDCVLHLSPSAKDKVFLLSDFFSEGHGAHRHVDIPDPIRMSGHFYKNVLEIISKCVKNLVESL